MSPAPEQRLTVSGETFEVTEPTRGTYHFAWVSGPQAGYGFTSQNADRSQSTPQQLEAAIRGFLRMVDQDTGVVPDDDLRGPRRRP